MRAMLRVSVWTLAMGAIALATRGAGAAELVIHFPAGSFHESVKACYEPAFTKATGAKVVYVLGGSVTAAAKIRASAGKSEIDVAYMDIHIADQVKTEGLLEKIDFTKLGSYPEVVKSAFDPDGFLVTTLATGTIIAYNPKVVNPAPTSWAEFENPKYRGKIALGDLQNTSGYHFLIAMARLHGGSLENIDPGFKAIKDLVPHVVTFYTQADQLVSLFDRGDVVLAPWYPDRAGAAADKGAPVAVAVPKEGGIGILGTVSIPKGTKNRDLAVKFVDVAVSAEAQKCFSERQYSAPVNRNVTLSPKAAALVAFGESFEKLYFPDFRYIAKNQPAWVERWRREIQK
jgi:putative spermidine/putrescine transport system substrate-binding protein